MKGSEMEKRFGASQHTCRDAREILKSESLTRTNSEQGQIEVAPEKIFRGCHHKFS